MEQRYLFAGFVMLTLLGACDKAEWPVDGGTDAGGGEGGAELDDRFSAALARRPLTEICDADSSEAGLIDLRERALAYLASGTEGKGPGDALAHIVRAQLDDGYTPPANLVEPADWEDIFASVDALEDTSDFRVLDLLAVLYVGGDSPVVSQATRERIDTLLRDFKYWFKDPTPSGRTDDMWYWTENHLVGFHAAEYLAGQRLADETFSVTGLQGSEHMARGRELLLDWFDTIRRFGFKEFHSDVYYGVQLRPLLLLAEYAQDDDIATLAANTADLMLFDLALHTRGGTFGAARGRTYKKDKLRTQDQGTFQLAKFLFDQTAVDYPHHTHLNVLLLASNTRYRVPRVIEDVAHDERPFVDRERMSVPLDEHEPVRNMPEAAYGLSFSDPDDLNVWWGMSALTPWQISVLSLQTMEQYNLWENASFSSFLTLRPLVALLPLARQLAYDNRTLLNAGVLSEVNSYTYRTRDYMLSSAQDRRFGMRSSQGHPWQATLGDDAFVFVTHPGVAPIESDNWRKDSDTGQWTGTASLPRSAQHGNVAIHLQSPAYGPKKRMLCSSRPAATSRTPMRFSPRSASTRCST